MNDFRGLYWNCRSCATIFSWSFPCDTNIANGQELGLAKKRGPPVSKRKTARRAASSKSVSKNGSIQVKRSGKTGPSRVRASEIRELNDISSEQSRLIDLAARYLGSSAAATMWFNRPKARLGGVSPAKACVTAAGRAKVERWLEEIGEGGFA